MDAEHKEQRDLNAEAAKEGTTPEHIQAHGERSRVRSSVTNAAGAKAIDGKLVDGYAQTEGEEYEEPQRDEREGYDPAQSGVRHAPNKPGTRTSAPGRDEGTAWAQSEQNGKATDVPGRKNPAD